jgi:Na+/serine symporter
MTKNPLYNALAALVYIVAIVLGMTAISNYQSSIDEIIMPIIILSLFTLSAAVMAYIFGYHTLQLFLDGKKKEAVSLFLKTVGIFGGVTLGLILIYLLFIL